MPEEPNANEDMQPEDSQPEEGAVDTSGDAGAPQDLGVSEDELQAALEAAEPSPEEASADAGAIEKPEAQAAVSDHEINAALEAADVPAESAPAESAAVNTDEIESAMENMLGQASESAAGAAAEDLADTAVETGAVDDVEAAMQAMLEGADEVESEEASQTAPTAPPPDAQPLALEEFGEAEISAESQIDMLDDVELEIKIELGRAEMYIEDVLGLGTGSVVELDRAAGDPVDIYVNEKLVARGEVLVLNDNFCVRINDILSPIPELEGD